MQAIAVSQPRTGYDVNLANGRVAFPIPSKTFGGGGAYTPPQYTSAPDFIANTYISYSYTIYPWADKTHEYIQEGMLIFLSRHINHKYRLYNMAPLWKLNIEAKLHYNMAWNQFENANNTELIEFKRLLRELGEKSLEDYHTALVHNRVPKDINPDLVKFHQLAKKEDYRYLTKFGILSHWNFGGVVLSKGESTGAAAYLDRHSETDTVYSVGVVIGERARTSNIWGSKAHIHPGSKVMLILRRVPLANGKFGHFEFTPYASAERDYPPVHLTTYQDESGRLCSGHVISVGVCTEAVERDPANGQLEMACGMIGGVQQSYEACGALPFVQLQLGI